MKKIMIDGVSCQHCVAHVKEALEEISGVEILEVYLEGKNALVNTEVEDNTLIAAIDEAGYDVTSIDKL